MKLRVTPARHLKPHPPESELGFGKHFTNHMYRMDYTQAAQWHDARLQPYAPLALEPATSVFHYGQMLFEGLKAFCGLDLKVRLFRPEMNARRMVSGAARLCMPAPSEAHMLESYCALSSIDSDWVPKASGTALYLRPTTVATEAFLGVRPAHSYTYFVIASPVGSYWGGAHWEGAKIWVETRQVRAPRGGLGAVKTGANYIASMYAAQAAKQQFGCQQVLWLDGQAHEFIEEMGTMNVFAVFGDTLVTPPLSDSILPGVVRDSVLVLGKHLGFSVEERPIALAELQAAHRAGTLREVFGTGTAAVIAPVRELLWEAGHLVFEGAVAPDSVARLLYTELTALQRAEKPDVFRWMRTVDASYAPTEAANASTDLRASPNNMRLLSK